MTKQELEEKIKELLSKDEKFKNVNLKIKYKEKS